MELSEERIAALRAEKGVPPDWSWQWCANDCGDIVFFDPIVVCSPACGREYLVRAAIR